MIFSLPQNEASAVLRAMLSCARADGPESPEEAELVQVAAGMLEVPLADTGAVPSISADELAAAFPDPVHRERVLQAMILMALVDGDVTGAEVALVTAFAAALGVDEPRVANLRHVSEGKLRTLWLDLARRSFARPVFERTLKEKGIRGVWKIVGPMVGLARDPELARRYIALGELPADTLGHAYFRFIVDHELGFPGEGIVAEEGVWHDVTHVLAGYDTSPEGELSVVSFIAGYTREDPFFWLFTIVLQFHLGIRVSPYSPGAKGHFDAELVLRALRRGAQMNRDLSKGFDPFLEMTKPLAQVRREMNVVP